VYCPHQECPSRVRQFGDDTGQLAVKVVRSVLLAVRPVPSSDHAVPPMPSEVTNGHDRTQRPAAGGMWRTAMVALCKMMH
jgi:hypothetical protein